MIKLTTTTFALALAAFAVGCAGTTEEEATKTAALPAGLTVEAKTVDSLSGRYQAEGSEVRFELTKSRDARTIIVRSLAGEALLQSTVDHGVETVTLFDGRLRVSGKVGAATPDMVGDESANDDLEKRAESAAITNLPSAIEEAFPGILDADSAGDLAPRIAPPGSLPPAPPPPAPKPRPDLASKILRFNEYFSFIGWQYTTKVYWAGWAYDPTNCISIRSGVTTQKLCHPSSGLKIGYWLNKSVTVKNVGAGTYGNDLLVNVY